MYVQLTSEPALAMFALHQRLKLIFHPPLITSANMKEEIRANHETIAKE
jgi:hypothetical protein